MTVSIVATAYSMRYGNAKTDAVVFVLGVTAGVAGLDIAGVGGRSESVAERAGDGMVTLCGVVGTATRGDGATIGEVTIVGGVGFTGEPVGISGVCNGVGFGGPAMSTSTTWSIPRSTGIVLGSDSPSLTPERRS